MWVDQSRGPVMATTLPARIGFRACSIVAAMVTDVPVNAPVHSKIFSRSRLRFTVPVSAAFGVLLALHNKVSLVPGILRAVLLGLAVLWVFGLFERWPRRLPKWLARSALQIVGVVFVIPIASAFAYLLSGGPTDSDHPPGLGGLIFMGLLFAPWISIGAILRQREARAREQEFAFQLERGELERKALDSRLRLLQAQVEPHFLFNTLANVQALVDAQSPQASKVLASLVAYLRAAVPSMDAPSTTLERELELVRAYLHLMQMRMPDRLQYALRVDPAAKQALCPPMTLLTLVENAVRHGIDPSETGGRIDTDISIQGDRCHIRVIDTGIGLKSKNHGLGTGLSTLRERLQLVFSGKVELQLTEISPHGVCAELSFPARFEGQ